MIIELKQDFDKVKKFLKENNIDYIAHDNVYRAVCYEEISITLENNDMDKEEINESIEELTTELYNSKGAEYAFQRLCEEASDIVSDIL